MQKGGEDIRRVIKLVKSINGVDYLVFFRNNGFATHSNLTDSWLTDKVAATASLLREVGNMMAAEVGKGEAETITLYTGDGSGVIVYTGPGQTVNTAIVFGKRTKLGVLLYTLKHLNQE